MHPSVGDGFQSGLAVVLTIFKLWLAAALAATLASAVSGEGVVLVVAVPALVAVAAAPFIRLSWFRELRTGMADERFRTGLVIALVLSVIALWAAMTVFAGAGSAVAPGGQAAIPTGLNLGVGGLVLASTLLGAVALYRLRRQHVRGSEWR